MRRLHAIAISILLGAGVAAGATASLKTVRLGAAAATTQATVPEKTIAARHAKLAAWSESLRKARAARPPALPKVPHYAPVQIPTMPSIQTPAVEPETTTVRHVVAAPAPAPPTTAAAPTEAKVTYVQPPPVVQYQQAPAATTSTAASGEDDGYGETSQHEDGWSGGASSDGHEDDG